MNDTKKLPVLIFIFGGGFTKGTADDTIHGPDFLLEREIIYVTISYRLGVLGFMSLGTPEFSGNMGLKDQQLALKWIYENIESFGGDNTRITLSGHSAGKRRLFSTSISIRIISSYKCKIGFIFVLGSMSVGHHFLHPETQNYFQQLLCMSGTSITATSYENGDHRCLMELLASYTKPAETTEELIEFLQNAPIEEFMRLTSVTKSPVDPIWAPIVESQLFILISATAFILISIRFSISQEKTPLIHTFQEIHFCNWKASLQLTKPLTSHSLIG